MPTTKIDFSRIKFELNWATSVIIIGLMVSIITYYVNMNNLKDDVGNMSKEIKKLNETVLLLKGAQDITNSAINNFMSTPPAELKYRIERLEGAVDKLSPIKNETPKEPFKNAKPE